MACLLRSVGLSVFIQQIPLLPHTHTLALILMHSETHTHKHTRTHTNTRVHTHTHVHTYKHTLMLIRSHTPRKYTESDASKECNPLQESGASSLLQYWMDYVVSFLPLLNSSLFAVGSSPIYLPSAFCVPCGVSLVTVFAHIHNTSMFVCGPACACICMIQVCVLCD